MKNQKGITLVALIITIIVMVILAGVIITAAVADGGIIERTQVAIKENERSDIQEIIIASYVFKVTASSQPMAYVDLEKTGVAIYDNLKAKGFELTNKITNSEGEYTAPVTEENGEKVMNIIISGDHGEYTGTVTEKGLKEDLKISEDENSDIKDEGEEPQIGTYELVKTVDDGNGGLEIIEIYANEAQVCAIAISNWDVSDIENKPVIPDCPEKTDLNNMIQKKMQIIDEENLIEEKMPVTYSILMGDYDAKYKDEYGDYSSYSGEIVNYVVAMLEDDYYEFPILNDDAFKNLIDSEIESYKEVNQKNEIVQNEYYETLNNFLKPVNVKNYTIPSEINGAKITKISKIGNYVELSGNLIISDNIKEIGNYTFSSTLISGIICSENTNLEKIGNWAFAHCENLYELNLPQTIKEIGACAFGYNSNLNEVNITINENSQMSDIFQGANNINKIIIKGNGSTGNIRNFFGSGVKCNELIVSEGYNSLGEIVNCKKVVLPNSLETIEDYAFCLCTELEEIIFPESSNIKTIGRNAFAQSSKITSIEIPEGVTSMGVQAFSWCKGLETVKLPNSLEKIENYMFEGCINLKKVEFGNNVSEISTGDAVFRNCYNINEIRVPGTIKYWYGGFIRDQENREYTLNIYYDGTKNELKKVLTHMSIFGDVKIICTDGTLKPIVELNENGSISSKGFEELN